MSIRDDWTAMRRTKRSLFCAWLGGCVALATLQTAAAQAPIGKGVAAEASVALQELPTQRLAKGQCALVAWRLSDRVRIFMALSEPAVGRLQIGGGTREFPRVAQDGQVVYGHAAQQTFAGRGLTVSIEDEFDAERRLLGGAMIRQGTLELKDGSGWTTMTPIGGLVACEP